MDAGRPRGVVPGSEFHLWYFAPVLGVMRVDTLGEAIDENSVDYGLTSGLHPGYRHWLAQWLDGIQAGNLYVNAASRGHRAPNQPFRRVETFRHPVRRQAAVPLYLLGLGDIEPAHDQPAGGSFNARESIVTVSPACSPCTTRRAAPGTS